MILPGFPRPMPMKGAPVPFVISGTYATDLEGWSSPTGFSWDLGSGSLSRTPPGIVFGDGYMDYTVAASVCGGLTIAASIWHRSNSGNSLVSLKYKIGTGPFILLDSASWNSSAYAQRSGSFDNPQADSITIRVEATVSAIFDDWMISGSLP